MDPEPPDSPVASTGSISQHTDRTSQQPVTLVEDAPIPFRKSRPVRMIGISMGICAAIGIWIVLDLFQGIKILP